MRRLHTEIDIDAPPAAVWAVLADTDRYREWNPFVHEVEGDLVPGERIRVRLGLGRTMRLRPTVLVADAARELRWRGRLGLPRLFDGEHAFRLEPRVGGGTHLVHAETFRGVLVPVLWPMLATDTEAGFRALNQALKDRVEARVEARLETHT